MSSFRPNPEDIGPDGYLKEEAVEVKEQITEFNNKIYNKPQIYNKPLVPQTYGKDERNLYESDEESSIFKNPMVWLGVGVLVMGLIYVMMPDDKKSVTSVVSATPTPSPVKKMARKGMKVRSGRKMSGRKMKRSGRIKK